MSLSRQIMLLNRHLLAYYKKELELAQVDLSLVDMLCLSYLYVHSGCRQDDFAKALLWDKAHVARHMQSLEQRGLITRSVHEIDKRVKVIETTPLGRSYGSLIRGIQRQWSDQVCEGDSHLAEVIEAELGCLLERAQHLLEP